MSILDLLPHVCSAKIRTRISGTAGGSRDDFSDSVFTDRECWQQVATMQEVEEFRKRGISVTDKIYFTTDPEVDERHNLVDVRARGATAGAGDEFEVRTRALPDASAGLGVVYKVMAEHSTVGTT